MCCICGGGIRIVSSANRLKSCGNYSWEISSEPPNAPGLTANLDELPRSLTFQPSSSYYEVNDKILITINVSYSDYPLVSVSKTFTITVTPDLCNNRKASYNAPETKVQSCIDINNDSVDF